jgi:hypothetical protein
MTQQLQQLLDGSRDSKPWRTTVNTGEDAWTFKGYEFGNQGRRRTLADMSATISYTAGLGQGACSGRTASCIAVPLQYPSREWRRGIRERAYLSSPAFIPGTEEAMLEELDAIDWFALEHAYGPADDVPGELRALLSPDPETRKGAQWTLYGNVYHQGTVYSATAFVVPTLLRLLADPSTPDRPWIIGYLASVADSHNAAQRVAAKNTAAAPEAWLTEWRRDAEDAHQAVREGLPLLLHLLDDPSAEMRREVAQALGSLHQDATVCAEAIQARLRWDDDQWVRAALHFALADLTGDATARHVGLTHAFETEAGAGARLQLAMRLVEEDGATVEDAPLACVIAAISPIATWSAQAVESAHAPGVANATGETDAARLQHVTSMALELAQIRAVGGVSPNIYAIAEALQRIEPQRLREAFEPLRGAMRTMEQGPNASFFVLQEVTKALLHIAFPTRSKGQKRTSMRLTGEQKTALEAIADSDTLWKYAPNVRSLLDPMGLPTERGELQRYVAEA